MPSPTRLLLPFACLLGCPPPWDPLVGCADVGACTTEAASTGVVTPTTSADDGVQTVTGDANSTTSPDASTGPADSTTGEPLEPPAIVTFELTPNPILFNGPIALTVTAAHAAGVRMALDSGDVIELAPSGPGVFSGEIPVLTGLFNGPYIALLTPWQDNLDGPTVEAPYEVALPDPGSQGFWEAGDLIGPGQVAAMGVLPTGEVIEFGTHFPNGNPRCYLRRRDKGGAWGPDDLAAVLPNTDCTAIDLKVDDQGAMFIVVNRQGNDGLRWWLAEIPAWGLGATNLGIGAKGETATALAHHPSGTVAVCGYAPTPSADIDAVAWVYRPNLPGETLAFDYQPDGKKPHTFSERTRDCVFAGDTLALVGEANGFHEEENLNPQRDRLFIFRHGVAADTPPWIVAPLGVNTQSGARAVAIDDQGRFVVAGYTCDDNCQPEGDLRIYDAHIGLAWQVSLGLFQTEQLGVQDLVWSPAGYAVVATGGTKGNESAFTVRAFTTSKVAPVWTFTREDDQALHLAIALALGPYGEVYAGGLGANGYPAVAYIGG